MRSSWLGLDELLMPAVAGQSFFEVVPEPRHGGKVVHLEQLRILGRAVEVLVPGPGPDREEVAGTPVVGLSVHDGGALPAHHVVELAAGMTAGLRVHAGPQ